jgi:ribosomal protein S18 acetylase RimI-like enzyme
VTYRFRHLWNESSPPTPATIDLLAPWVIEASRPFADWYFGEPDVAAEILREWMARPGSEIYAGRATLIEDDSALGVGCIITVPGGDLGRSRAEDFAVFCAEIESEPTAAEMAGEVLTVSQELFPPVASGDLYISRVGVDPSRRGHGIGRALVRHAVEMAGDLDMRGCRLDVSSDNAAAIRAYEAAGLVVISTSRSVLAGLSYSAMRADVGSRVAT